MISREKEKKRKRKEKKRKVLSTWRNTILRFLVACVIQLGSNLV